MAKKYGEIYKDGRVVAEIDENCNITNNHGEHIGETDEDGDIFYIWNIL